MQTLLNIPDQPLFKRGQGKYITRNIRSKFDLFWIDSINSTTSCNQNQTDLADHNKLRTYRTFKSSFTREPFIDLIRNRNQKSFLTRLRTGSHFLNVERGRWTRPPTPVEERTCTYCTPASSTPGSPCPPSYPTNIDDEYHFLMHCSLSQDARDIAFQDISLILPWFNTLSEKQKFGTLLCPTTAKIAKIVNKLIKQMFETRAKYDQDHSQP